jgi:hypothetical protein
VVTKAVAALCDIVVVPARNMIPIVVAKDDDTTDDFIVLFGFFVVAISILERKFNYFSTVASEVDRSVTVKQTIVPLLVGTFHLMIRRDINDILSL